MCVFSPVQAKSKTEQCQRAFNYHSMIVEHEREKESAIIMCVQFSVGLCQWIYICVCIHICSCMCLPRGAHLCHCQYVQAGSGGQLCACV